MVLRNRARYTIHKFKDPKVSRHGDHERRQALEKRIEAQGPFLLPGKHPILL